MEVKHKKAQEWNECPKWGSISRLHIASIVVSQSVPKIGQCLLNKISRKPEAHRFCWVNEATSCEGAHPFYIPNITSLFFSYSCLNVYFLYNNGLKYVYFLENGIYIISFFLIIYLPMIPITVLASTKEIVWLNSLTLQMLPYKLELFINSNLHCMGIWWVLQNFSWQL